MVNGFLLSDLFLEENRVRRGCGGNAAIRPHCLASTPGAGTMKLETTIGKSRFV